MAPIHDRMPMLLTNNEQQAAWFDSKTTLPDVLGLLQIPPDGTLEYDPVSPLVGNVRNNGAELHVRL